MRCGSPVTVTPIVAMSRTPRGLEAAKPLSTGARPIIGKSEPLGHAVPVLALVSTVCKYDDTGARIPKTELGVGWLALGSSTWRENRTSTADSTSRATVFHQLSFNIFRGLHHNNPYTTFLPQASPAPKSQVPTRKDCTDYRSVRGSPSARAKSTVARCSRGQSCHRLR